MSGLVLAVDFATRCLLCAEDKHTHTHTQHTFPVKVHAVYNSLWSLSLFLSPHEYPLPDKHPFDDVDDGGVVGVTVIVPLNLDKRRQTAS